MNTLCDAINNFVIFKSFTDKLESRLLVFQLQNLPFFEISFYQYIIWQRRI